MTEISLSSLSVMVTTVLPLNPGLAATDTSSLTTATFEIPMPLNAKDLVSAVGMTVVLERVMPSEFSEIPLVGVFVGDG